jgi:hypothetical protein
VQKGVICINRDCHWENDDGSCSLHVERTYLARSSESCTIYELSGSYIRKITITVNDLEKILTMYDAFLAQTEEE